MPFPWVNDMQGVRDDRFGLILLVLGLLLNGAQVLFTIGIILLLVGLVLNFVPIGGTRRRFY